MLKHVNAGLVDRIGIHFGFANRNVLIFDRNFAQNDEIALEFNGYRNFVHNYKYDYRKIITD